jgi:5-methylcytosine-specific restriction endonuclease McrA
MSDSKKNGCTAKKKLASPHQPTGEWIRKKKRLAINLRDGMRCLYCCKDLHGADPRDITLDHLVCKIDGGSNHESNLVTACRACNCARQDKPIARFCGPETRADIKRVTSRKLTSYLKLAQAYLDGKVGAPDIENK